jgi:hypothetical protein
MARITSCDSFVVRLTASPPIILDGITSKMASSVIQSRVHFHFGGMVIAIKIQKL